MDQLLAVLSENSFITWWSYLMKYGDHGCNSKQINAMAWLNDKLNQAWYNEWLDMIQWMITIMWGPHWFFRCVSSQAPVLHTLYFPKKYGLTVFYFTVFILSDPVIYIPLSFRVALLTLGKLADNKPLQCTNTIPLCPLPMVYCISSNIQSL